MSFYWSQGLFCKQDIKRQFGKDAKPYERVILALLRLSRDKYLHPDAVRHISRKLACCLNGNHWWQITKKVFDDEDVYRADHSGLISGFVPFQNGSLQFMQLLDFLRTRKRIKPLQMEMLILKLTIQELKNGQK